MQPLIHLAHTQQWGKLRGILQRIACIACSACSAELQQRCFPTAPRWKNRAVRHGGGPGGPRPKITDFLFFTFFKRVLNLLGLQRHPRVRGEAHSEYQPKPRPHGLVQARFDFFPDPELALPAAQIRPEAPGRPQHT